MHLKKKTFREFFLVTIEPQYANEIDSVPSQSFMQFKLHRLKKRVEDKYMVLYLSMRTYNRQEY